MIGSRYGRCGVLAATVLLTGVLAAPAVGAEAGEAAAIRVAAPLTTTMSAR